MPYRLVTPTIVLALVLTAGPAAAQSLTVESSGALEVQKELDVDGALTYAGPVTLNSTSGVLKVAGDVTKNGGSLTPNGRAVLLDGSSQQSVGGGTIAFADLTLDNASGAKLTSSVDVTGTLTLTSGQLTTNGNLTLSSTSETDVAYISGSGNGSVSGAVTFERYLDKSDDASHFRMLSAPTETLLDDESSGSNAGNLLSNMWTQSETGTGADAAGPPSVFVYNEAADLNDGNPDLAGGWESVGQSDGNWGQLNDLTSLSGQTTIDPGRGFLAFLFADLDPPAGDGDEGFPQTLTATGTVQAEENNGSAINPPITFNGSDGDGTANNGWNLIANPFMAPLDWESIENGGLTNVDKTIYVWDPSANSGNGAYATYTANGSGTNGQTQYIPPFQAFFVKANGSNPSIGGIDSGDKAIGQTPEFKSTGNSTPQITLRLRAEGDTTGETTAFRFAEGAPVGKDPYDAYQLEPFGTARTLVASEMAAADALFDHQNRPMPAGQDTIDLALDITQSGTYTLGAGTLENLPSGWSVILENTDSGARYDLGAGDAATFEVPPPESAPKTAPSSSLAAMLQQGQPTVAKAGSGDNLPSFRLFVGPDAELPVELASFEATANGPRVLLTWQTASETNNAGFAVERRVDVRERGGEGERGWTRVGFVESKASGGTSSEPKRYRFTDADLPFKVEEVAYRLRQEDVDGTTTLSDKVTVQLSAPSKTRLHAPFPNPARRQVTLRYELKEAADLSIGIYDLLGRRVRTLVSGRAAAGRHEERMATGALAPGTYFVRMRVGQRIQTRRFTVLR